jgi:hypothetical protein
MGTKFFCDRCNQSLRKRALPFQFYRKNSNDERFGTVPVELCQRCTQELMELLMEFHSGFTPKWYSQAGGEDYEDEFSHASEA